VIGQRWPAAGLAASQRESASNKERLDGDTCSCRQAATKARLGGVSVCSLLCGIHDAFVSAHSPGHIRVTPEQAAYFESLWPLDYMLFLAVAALNLAGAVSLFVLRRFAFQLFAAAVLLNIVVTIVYAASKGWLAALGGRWSGRHVARVRSLGRNLRLRLEAQVARSIGMTTDRGR
jgi:hypothetical protein